MIIRAGSTVLVRRSANQKDVAEHVADNAQLSLAPEGGKRPAGKAAQNPRAVARRWRRARGWQVRSQARCQVGWQPGGAQSVIHWFWHLIGVKSATAAAKPAAPRAATTTAKAPAKASGNATSTAQVAAGSR